jgi:hypothetical protein
MSDADITDVAALFHGLSGATACSEPWHRGRKDQSEM